MERSSHVEMCIRSIVVATLVTRATLRTHTLCPLLPFHVSTCSIVVILVSSIVAYRHLPSPTVAYRCLPLPTVAYRCLRYLPLHTRSIVVILVSSICLAMDSPRLDPDSSLSHILKKLDLLWTAIFAVECTLKIIALGFVCNGPRSYLRDAWNILDFCIVLVSLVMLTGIDAVKPLRILRALRPLRLVSRSPGMRLMVTSLVKSMPAVTNTLGVVLAFMLVFAILGMQLFSDSFGSCSDETITTRELCHAHLPPAPPPAPPFSDSGVPGRALFAAERSIPSPAPSFSHEATAATVALGLTPGDVLNATWQPVAVAASAALELAGVAQHTRPVGPSQGARGARRRDSAVSPHRRRSRRRRLKSGGGGSGGGWDGGSEVVGTIWMNPPFGSFDDFGSSMLLLYIMSTGDGWDEIMFSGMAAVGPGIAPVRNDTSMVALYFILWILIGGLVAMNLFVGVIVENFNRISKEGSASATMTLEQLQWVNSMKAMRNTLPHKTHRPPKNRCRLAIYHLIHSPIFDQAIGLVIVLNILVMGCDFWGIEQPENARFYSYYNGATLVFTNIYYGEFVLKVFAMDYYYFRDSWCRFDFFLVITSLLDQVAVATSRHTSSLPSSLHLIVSRLHIVTSRPISSHLVPSRPISSHLVPLPRGSLGASFSSTTSPCRRCSCVSCASSVSYASCGCSRARRASRTLS